MADAHSRSSLVTSLSYNQPSIRITSAVACTVLTGVRVLVEPGLNVATDSRAPDPLLIRSQASFLHAVKDFVKIVSVVCQGWCRYYNVIHIGLHEIPIVLCYAGQSLSLSVFESSPLPCTSRWHPLPLVEA